MSQMNVILGRLRSARLSQAEISRRTGIPQPRLSKWWNGRAPRSADDVLALARLAAELGTTQHPVPESGAPAAQPSQQA